MLSIIDKLKFDVEALQPVAGFFAGVAVIEAVKSIHDIQLFVGALTSATCCVETSGRARERSYKNSGLLAFPFTQ